MSSNAINNPTAGGGGQFNSAAPTQEHQLNDKHQPGKLVGNDAVPTFHAQTVPSGTAPADRTFKPNPTDEAPPVQSHANAEDTITGATSGDVHTGLGHPGAGQSSKELHDGSSTRTGGVEGLKTTGQGTVDPHDPAFAGQRALDKDEAKIGRSDVPGAHERVPESAESVASERR